MYQYMCRYFQIGAIILNLTRFHGAFGQSLSPIDVVAIIPDRSTAYPNGLHNGLLAAASTSNVTLEIQDFGNFDPDKSKEVLQAAIESEVQPRIYCIWPVDLPSRELMKQLFDTQKVPIIQLNQLPSEETAWEWDHLLGYAGPSDALRASNAGLMMIEALEQKGIENPKVVALGYPATYGGYHLSIAAFRRSIEGSALEITHDLPLDWGNQPAYDAIVSLMDELKETGGEVHGVYSMDDNILIGAYQALQDRGMLDGPSPSAVTLVGTVCNGHRELLATGQQYGTTIQSPFLEAALAIDSAVEYLSMGQISEQVRFTPNPVATTSTWESQIVEFLGDFYTADSLCTWKLDHERINGLKDVNDAMDPCEYVDCSFIPEGLFYSGYVIVCINFALCMVGFTLLYIHRQKKVVLLAQPFFLSLILLGAMVDTTSIIFMSRDNRNYSDAELDRACMSWVWLLAMGQMMTTTTLVAKIARVKAVIGVGSRHGTLRRAKVSIRDVSGFIIGGLALDIAILSVWAARNPYRWKVQAVSRDFEGLILEARGECSSDGESVWVYALVLLLVHLGILIYGNILALQTRNYHQVSDSRMVAISLFNSIQLLLVAAIMLSLSDDNVSISYVVRASYAFLNNVGVILLVVGPKIYACVVGKGDVIPDLHSGTSSGGADGRNNRTHISGLEPNSQAVSVRLSLADTFNEITSRSRIGTVLEEASAELETGSQDSEPNSNSDVSPEPCPEK